VSSSWSTSVAANTWPTSPPSPSSSTHRAAHEAQVLNEQLHHALTSYVVIEQAKGIIAEQQHFNMEQAFSALRIHARNRTRRLIEVAEAVINGLLSVASLDRPLAGEPY